MLNTYVNHSKWHLEFYCILINLIVYNINITSTVIKFRLFDYKRSTNPFLLIFTFRFPEQANMNWQVLSQKEAFYQWGIWKEKTESHKLKTFIFFLLFFITKYCITPSSTNLSPSPHCGASTLPICTPCTPTLFHIEAEWLCFPPPPLHGSSSVPCFTFHDFFNNFSCSTLSWLLPKFRNQPHKLWSRLQKPLGSSASERGAGLLSNLAW